MIWLLKVVSIESNWSLLLISVYDGVVFCLLKYWFWKCLEMIRWCLETLRLYNGGFTKGNIYVCGGLQSDITGLWVYLSDMSVSESLPRCQASVWLILTCCDLFSVSYTMDDIILDWLSDKKGSLRVSHDLKIPQYTLVGWEQTSQVQEYSTGTLHYFKWCSMWWNTMNILREISSGFSDFWTPFLSWITLLPI